MHMPSFKRQWTVDDLQDLPDDGNRYAVIDGALFVTGSVVEASGSGRRDLRNPEVLLAA